MTFDGPELARNAANHTALSPVSILKRRRARASRTARARAGLAGYMRLKKVIFGELPKTSTGKIRKNEFRDLVRQQG